MDFSKLSRSEATAIAGGLLLGIALFIGWYHAKTQFAHLNGHIGPNYTGSAWDVHPILRYFLLLAAIGPLILAYIVARGHALSWPRGELTAVGAITAFGLIAYSAFITRPGSPRSEIALKPGVFLAVVGTALMVVGAAMRTGEVERRRQPPGTVRSR